MLRDRLRDAAEDGIVIGVKWGIALALSLLCVGYAVNDYALTRIKADHGAQAFQFIQDQIAAQKAATGAK